MVIIHLDRDVDPAEPFAILWIPGEVIYSFEPSDKDRHLFQIIEFRNRVVTVVYGVYMFLQDHESSGLRRFGLRSPYSPRYTLWL